MNLISSFVLNVIWYEYGGVIFFNWWENFKNPISFAMDA